ncbi:MC/SLC25 family protein, partial [Escherichia coli]|nr:MC/SLC25 family protein [Escherichia coli]
VRFCFSRCGSAFRVFRNVVATEGPLSLYRGMAAPLASVTFQVILLPPFDSLFTRNLPHLKIEFLNDMVVSTNIIFIVCLCLKAVLA